MELLARIKQGFLLSGFRARREEFYEQMAASLESREKTQTFLMSEVRISSDPKTKDPSRAYALQMMLRKLTASDSVDIASIVGVAMPASDRMSLAAVQDAPNKPAVLRSLAASIRRERELVSVMRKAVLPPLMVLPGVFFQSYVTATKTVPLVVKMAPPEVWTPFNSLFRSVAEAIGAYGIAGVIVLLLLGALLKYQLPRWTGPSRKKLESVPPGLALLGAPLLVPLSIYRDTQAALMLNSLAVFLQSGRKLTDGLETIARNGTPWMRWKVRAIINHLKVSPDDYIAAFSKGLLSSALLAKLSSTIRTNPQFDQVLISLGTTGTKQIQEQVQKQASAINYLILAFAGAMVALMMLGPMSVTNSMQDEMQPAKVQARMMKARQALGH